ncbi:hypothetical protein ACTFIV_008192 [Dictyostelium citrinum]
MGELFFQSIILYLIVWAITILFKLIYNHIPLESNKIKFKNWFFKLDILISIGSIVLLLILIVVSGDTNISLLKIIIENDIFEYPHSLKLLSPIAIGLSGIAFYGYKLKSIKKYRIQLNEIQKNINNNENQQISKYFKSYSYESNSKKIILSIFSITWWIFPLLIFRTIGCNQIDFYENANDRDSNINPKNSIDLFSTFILIIVLLNSFISVIVMEISMAL